MKFTAKRSRLAEVSTLVGQAVAGKSTKRVYECIRLTASDQGLEIAGTDLELAARYSLTDEIQVKEAGEVVVPAQIFTGVLREIGDETVSLSSSQRKLTLETDGGKFELECEDPEQFPEIPVFPSESTCRMAAADLRALVRKTVFAAGKEAARFVLNGVRVSIEGEALRFVACDGRRLSTLCRPIELSGESAGGERVALVGLKGLQHFDRLAAEVDGAVDLAIADRFVALRTKGAEAVVRVLDGSFPNHHEIIPDEVALEATIPVGRLQSCLRQVAPFTTLESQAVVLTFSSGELRFSAGGGEGRADIRLGIDFEGDEVRIGFNPGFMLDALKNVDGESIRFGFNNSRAAARITDDAGMLYVIMPLIVE